MEIFNLIMIIFVCLLSTNAFYILTNKFSLKNYTLARTKIDAFFSNAFEQKAEGSFIVRISDEAHKVFVNAKRIPHLYTNRSEIIFLNGNTTTNKKLSNYHWSTVEGFVERHSNNSGVNGYVKHGKFYGTIIINEKLYYVEDKERFPTLLSSRRNNDEFNAIIYDEGSILNENERSSFERIPRRSHYQKMPMSEAASKIIYKEFTAQRHICPLLIILDNSFLKKIHKSDMIAAVAQVMLSINEVNSVFRSTDFDGDGTPDNIGFIIKYLVIIENEDSPFNYIPMYTDQPVSPRFYLAHFAQYLILREVCLGILFTAQPFQENVLGVSYSAISETDISNDIIGGICQRPFTSYMLSLNAVAVSYISTQGLQLPQATLDTCLIHELGHAFGCRHDRKSDPGYSEEYIMSSHTLPGTSAKNFQFSPMSKKHLVMTVPKKGHCLLKSIEPFCGNGITEKGEECDCGAKYLCQSTDPCCIPSGMNGGCNINRAAGHECHPSQGFCCTSGCKYENLKKIGVVIAMKLVQK
ncbi:disintegrin and metalloproteinase domain-containing protein 10-like isoform X2 [Coccinella septempunctata]|uniref:disintegrin and metalloproteinase domain-containing protein 10-like isoform X2 n=1 Tax=Coccinella septempunctata TaxID=41139 RepID=UPI001D0860B2|nr:disintegrin and metalloproteinase domain-containing protein 10-like isoform X2 [Coccinella septempunctata]